MLEEVGCAVCGELSPENNSVPIDSVRSHLEFLDQYASVTRTKRNGSLVQSTYQPGPVLDRSCHDVCNECLKQVRYQLACYNTSIYSLQLKDGILPKNSLANGLWISDVPHELQILTWAEQQLVQSVRANAYLVQVTSGWHKMMSNIVAYENPTPKIYSILPPPLADNDALFSVVFFGPEYPSDATQMRSPLLVREHMVCAAIEWLINNSSDYFNVKFSETNMRQYPSMGNPFAFTYAFSKVNRGPENTSVNETMEEDGTSVGDCPYVIHGLLGSDVVDKNWTQMTTMAMRHLKPDQKVLAVGHAKQPESIFNNPLLYPKIFPWLFPYGMGRIGNANIVKNIFSQKQKAHLLKYHDKQFQKDKLFPIIAFNHEQIQSSSKRSYLLTKRFNLDQISENILGINLKVLDDIITRMNEGERIVPITYDEKKCFRVLNDVDHIAADMDRSLTSKK